MRRRGLALGIAFVAAAAALALAAGGAAALHGQGADDGDPYLFHEKYVVNGLKTDQEHFEVTIPEGPERTLCYLRSFQPGVAGSWSSVVYDARNEPVIEDTGVWTDRTPDEVPIRSVAVAEPLTFLHKGEFGTWTLQVRSAGFSPEVHVYVEWVDGVDACDHPPDDV